MEQTLQEKLMQQLHLNFHLMTMMHDEARAKNEQGHGQDHIIKALHVNGDDMNRDELASKMRRAPADVEHKFQSMQEMGLIQVNGLGEDAKYSLTEAGRRKAEEIMTKRREMARQVFANLTESDQTKLYELMQKLNLDMRKQTSVNEAAQDHDYADCGIHFENACPHKNKKPHNKVRDVGDPDHTGPGYRDHNPEG